MKFVSGDAGVAGTVQVVDKAVHQVEKVVFGKVVVFAVEPVDFVASDQLVLYDKGMVADPCGLELFFGIEGDQIGFEAGGQSDAQKIFGQPYFIRDKTVDKAIEGGLQAYKGIGYRLSVIGYRLSVKLTNIAPR